MKNIYLDIAGKKHSLYDNLINYPPEGYFFKMFPEKDILKNLSNNEFLYALQKNVFNKLFPVNYLKSYLQKNRYVPENVDFIYSSGHPIFFDFPWVVDLEFSTHLCGYSKSFFDKHKKQLTTILENDSCKKILPWTNAGKKTIIHNFDSDVIEDKIETVHLAVPPKNCKKTRFDEKIQLLFVSSQNIPKDFDIKGGKEVLKSFELIDKEYDNVELIVRSYVPKKIKRKYRNNKNIKILDEILPWKKMESIFQNSDIFLFPSYNTPGLAFLDAMSYGLPIITTDVWANNEMIIDGKNGLLVPPSQKIEYYSSDFVPLWSEKKNLNIIKNQTDEHVVTAVADQIRLLIDNENTRLKMGDCGRRLIEAGEFSLKKRNASLKKIFDNIGDE